MSVPYALYAKTAGNGPAGARRSRNSGVIGAQGIQGEQGPQGIQGDHGPTGCMMEHKESKASRVLKEFKVNRDQQDHKEYRGTEGPQGIQGDQGPQGIQGDPGPTGAAGAQGIQGEQGSQGIQGDQGPTGTMERKEFKADSGCTRHSRGPGKSDGLLPNGTCDWKYHFLGRYSSGLLTTIIYLIQEGTLELERHTPSTKLEVSEWRYCHKLLPSNTKLKTR